jgi:hypothetical protein
MQYQRKLFVALLLVVFSFSVVAYTAPIGGTLEVVSAETFVPKPNLRIEVAGILGSDGTRFTQTLVTATIGSELLVTEATTELTYIEYGNKVIDASKDRGVVRYIREDNGISQDPIVARWGEKKWFWLPRNIEVGVQWKAPWGKRREIMEKDVTVETPAGRFEGCIMVEYDVYAGGTGIERHYIAPGVGVVKILSLRGPQSTKSTTWYEVQRIENLEPAAANQMVGQMLGR